MIANGEFFDKFTYFADYNYMVSATTPGEDTMTEKKGAREEGRLVPGHCYAILSTVEVYLQPQGSDESYTTRKGDKDSELVYKLMKLRNPWGNFEW